MGLCGKVWLPLFTQKVLWLTSLLGVAKDWVRQFFSRSWLAGLKQGIKWCITLTSPHKRDIPQSHGVRYSQNPDSLLPRGYVVSDLGLEEAENLSGQELGPTA